MLFGIRPIATLFLRLFAGGCGLHVSFAERLSKLVGSLRLGNEGVGASVAFATLAVDLDEVASILRSEVSRRVASDDAHLALVWEWLGNVSCALPPMGVHYIR